MIYLISCFLKLYITGVLIFIFLMINEAEHFLMFLLVICVPLWNGFLFHFLIFLFFLIYIVVLEIIYSGYKSIVLRIATIFSHLFSFLNVFRHVEVLNFNFFMICTFCIYLEDLLMC